ncbi:MAG: hypothetical protein NVSMB4_06850 [Acidimicrobiales bacterium]
MRPDLIDATPHTGRSTPADLVSHGVGQGLDRVAAFDEISVQVDGAMELFEARRSPAGDDRQSRLAQRKTVKKTGPVCGRGEWGLSRTRRSTPVGWSGPGPQSPPQFVKPIKKQAAIEGELQSSSVELIKLRQ